MRRSEAEVPTIFNPHRVRAPPNLVVTADSSPLQPNQYHRQPSLHHQDSVCQQLGTLQQDGLAEPLHPPPQPSITKCARSCCSSNARKIYSGVLVTICVTASWVGATHFIKYMYLPQAVTRIQTSPSNTSTNVVSQKNMIYNAPFFTTWFCTNWTILFFPLYFIFQLISRKCKSPSEIIAESLRNFRDKGFTIGRFFWRCVCFCLLWVSTNYMYIHSLRKLQATDVMTLFATNVAFVYLLSWVILHQQFVGIRIVAVIMCDTGIALLAYMDGLSKSPILSSVVLAAFAAASSAVYKVLFKKVIGDASFGQIALFFSLIGLFNALFLWPIVLCLYFTGTEIIFWDHVPWVPLLAAAILSLVANLLGNFSVALTYDLFVTLGLITAVPVSAALDVVLYGEHFQGMKLAGMILIGIGFFLVMLPDNWPDYITRLLRNIILLSHSARHVNQIDAVLLTFPDPHHLGALPYLVGKCGLSCPIYATIPVYKMGQMFMYDLFQSRYNMEEFDIFNLDDVDAAFDKIIQLKYNQSVTMKGKGYGLTIVPLPAGHMIGGTMWKIMKVGEEDIIYAIDVNHKKERHLNGCDLERPQRPSLLITDALNATYIQDRRRLRDERLITTILQTLRAGGNVLIAVDTAGRLLELAHMLDQFWRSKTSGLLVYSLLLLNNVSYNVVEFAKSQIEWMSDKLMKSFEVQRNNPFQFKYLHLCHSLAELNKITGPKVVLASSPDLESGFSRDIFLEWASDSNNSIILTTRSGSETLAMKLIDLEGKDKDKRSITVTIKQRVKLEGEELQQYLDEHQEDNEDKDSSDSDDEVQFMSSMKGGHDIVVKPELKKRSSKSKRKNYPMYPLLDQKIKFDDYGEIIRPEDYMLSENRDDVIELKDVKPNIEDEPMDTTEIPTKCISYEKTIDVNASIQYIDFEGRSDGKSIESIISGLKPHRVILVRGTKASTELLATHISELPDIKVFTPSKGDCVDATTETHIYQVRLTDGLVSALKFQKGKEMELAWLDSRVSGKKKISITKPINLDAVEENKGEEEEEMETDKVVDLDDMFTLEPIPLTEVDPHEQVFVNELKLSDLKVVLSKNQIDSEFSGRKILWCCNNTIALRRAEGGMVCLEGAVSENYYRVRDLLYSQYAIL